MCRFSHSQERIPSRIQPTLFKDGLRRLALDPPASEKIVLYLTDIDKLSRSWSMEAIWSAPEEEVRRARSYQVPGLGRRFLASRRLLRILLGHHSQKNLENTVFQKEANGRLRLEGYPLSFNLSHSGPLLAIGLALSGRLGIDLECRVEKETIREVAPRVLTPSEQSLLPPHDSRASLATFLQYWTLKEAILKSSGEGLERDMKEIEVRVPPAPSPPRIIALPETYGLPLEWEVGHVSTGLDETCLAFALHTA